MIRICAWCEKFLGEKPPYEDKSITHTICPECAKKMEEDDESSRRNKKEPEHNPQSRIPQDIYSRLTDAQREFVENDIKGLSDFQIGLWAQTYRTSRGMSSAPGQKTSKYRVIDEQGYEMYPVLVVRYPVPVKGYFDGTLSRVEYHPEAPHYHKPHSGQTNRNIRWGSWSANHWFVAGSGSSWRMAAANARKRLMGLMGIPYTHQEMVVYGSPQREHPRVAIEW